MKKSNFVLLAVFSLFSISSSFADGPCGAGHYVRRCGGGCGVPYGCHMMCDGPEYTNEAPAPALNESEEVRVENARIANILDHVEMCH